MGSLPRTGEYLWRVEAEEERMNINDTRKRVKRALSGVNDDFPGENPLADIAINCGASFDEIAQWPYSRS
jgi:hypothetical protein